MSVFGMDLLIPGHEILDAVRLSVRSAAIAVLAVSSLPGQPVPQFRAENVRPHGAESPHPLVPGMLVWIFGSRLGRDCGASNSMDSSTYRTNLCGTRVLVGGLEAKLIYVSDGQINLKLPDGAWRNQNVEFQVIRDGVPSVAVPVHFGSGRPEISLPEPAYAGLPIWLRVEKPWGTGWLRYPFHVQPWDMGSTCLEVRHEGKVVRRLPFLPAGMECLQLGGWLGLSAEPPERYLHRLPLHLLYSIDQPGQYQIRYWENASRYVPGVIPESEWTTITILPSTAEQRRQQLTELATSAPQNEVELLTNFLPSLLAWRDERALRILAPYLDHSSALVRSYSGYALYYFEEDLRKRIVPGREPILGAVR